MGKSIKNQTWTRELGRRDPCRLLGNTHTMVEEDQREEYEGDSHKVALGLWFGSHGRCDTYSCFKKPRGMRLLMMSRGEDM